MGCSGSKDAVQEITVENGVVKPASAKTKKIKVNSSATTKVNDDQAIHVTSIKSTSAKSRDSGIEEMEATDLPDGIITETSDPHLIADVEDENRPKTPNLSLTGHPLGNQTTTRERTKSKVILEELQSQGLITGANVQKGGAAFDVNVGSNVVLEPLPPIRPPPRLERLNQDKPTLTKEDLELKQKRAELRREKSMHGPKRRSRLASQLAKDREMANNMKPADDDDVNPEDGSSFNFDEKTVDPFKSRHTLAQD